MRTKQSPLIFLIFTAILLLRYIMCGGKETNREISTQKDIVSCEYSDLGEKNGQPVVNLIFKNSSGKDLASVVGGLRIISRSGEVIQRAGFTYSRPFKAGEQKNIPAFAFIEIEPEALKILSSAADFIPMVFELSEVQYADGESVVF